MLFKHSLGSHIESTTNTYSIFSSLNNAQCNSAQVTHIADPCVKLIMKSRAAEPWFVCLEEVWRRCMVLITSVYPQRFGEWTSEKKMTQICLVSCLFCSLRKRIQNLHTWPQKWGESKDHETGKGRRKNFWTHCSCALFSPWNSI